MTVTLSQLLHTSLSVDTKKFIHLGYGWDLRIFVRPRTSLRLESLNRLVRLLLADHEKNGVICGWLEPLY